MPSFVFLCNLNTEAECLRKSLFGTNPGESHKLYYSKISEGNRLFLYNYDTGILRGPFSALTPCKFQIDRKAWGSIKGGFPWQVRVSDAGKFDLPLNADELRNLIPLSNARIGPLPPAEMTDKQTALVLGAMEKKNKPT